MVIIVNSCEDESCKLAALLDTHGIKNLVSIKESDIISAERLIFPPVNDLSRVIKKFHLLNLTSLLRMMKKPVLGIGSGVQLMLEFGGSTKESCLSYFTFDGDKDNYCNQLEFNHGLYTIKLTKESPLFSGIAPDEQFYFDFLLKAPQQHALASAIVDVPDTAIAALEKDHVYGVFFDIVKSGKPGEKILKNFCQIL
jgi:glutamine amidotransferase